MRIEMLVVLLEKSKVKYCFVLSELKILKLGDHFAEIVI